MSLISVTVWTPASRGVFSLRSWGDAWVDPPPGNPIAYVGEEAGMLVMHPAVETSVLVTVEVGPLIVRPDATLAYAGPINLRTHNLAIYDGEGSVDPLPYELEPGTHRVVAQVTGREASIKAHEEFLSTPDAEWDSTPMEHWYITFPEDEEEEEAQGGDLLTDEPKTEPQEPVALDYGIVADGP